ENVNDSIRDNVGNFVKGVGKVIDDVGDDLEARATPDQISELAHNVCRAMDRTHDDKGEETVRILPERACSDKRVDEGLDELDHNVQGDKRKVGDGTKEVRQAHLDLCATGRGADTRDGGGYDSSDRRGQLTGGHTSIGHGI